MLAGISSRVSLVVFLYLSFVYSIIQLCLFRGAWSLRLEAFKKLLAAAHVGRTQVPWIMDEVV